MKKCLLKLLVLLLASAPAVAQTVSGRVTNSADGTALPGVSVLFKGTTAGTTTDVDGRYSINASDGNSILVFSFIGYATQEVQVGNRTAVDITLQEDITQLGEVVVTALGIERETKSLSYAAQQVSGSELTRAKDANFINTLSGRIAGVTINRSPSGVGGSSRVVMRGNKSTRNNQPLYVVDGVPLVNYSPAQPGDIWGQSSGGGTGGRDGGDGIANLNPDDIETITVLKGASGATLYGSAGANGVIIITTKKAKAGTAKLDFSSNLTFESPIMTPDLQFKYGQTTPQTSSSAGSEDSWGDTVTPKDHVDGFFETGRTWINSVSIGGGTEKSQTFFSYSNTDSKGMLPTSALKRHTFNFHQTGKLFGDKVTADADIKFINQSATNRAVSGLYNNPLTGLYMMPRGLDFDTYKDQFEIKSSQRNMMTQNWWNINTDKNWGGADYQQNPYFSLHRNRREEERNRAIANASLKYQANDWLNVQVRGNVDKTFDNYTLKSNASTQSVLAAPNGRYTLDRYVVTQLYGDLLVNMTKNLATGIDLTATAGASINDYRDDRIFVDTKTSDPEGLYVANFFALQNVTQTAKDETQSSGHSQKQALFLTSQLSYNDYLYFDLSLRNDWSSTFAFTPSASKGYLYYSVGATAVISEMVQLPELVNFAKFRLSYAKVGNDVPAYVTNPRFSSVSSNGNSIALNQKAPFPGLDLVPEDNRSFETGAEVKLLDSRINLDLTYYVNNNYDQYIEVPASGSTQYTTYYLNLGNIQNKGIEIALSGVPVKTDKINWTTTFTYTKNKNKIKELSKEGVWAEDGYFAFTDFGVNMYASYFKEGGSWGDFYANKELMRDDDGAIFVEADGTPIVENLQGSAAKKLGSPLPDFTWGWNNTVDIGNAFVSFLIDGRVGGKVISVTQAVLDKYGVSQDSEAGRGAEGMDLQFKLEDGTPYTGVVTAQQYYQKVGGRDGVASEYAYDATNVRLREFSVGYRLPVKFKGISSVSLSAVGRNLFFFSIDAPFDPDMAMSTGNGLQGVDVFGMPSARSIGFNVKVGF